MENLTNGIVIMLVGMGGTLVSLFGLTLVINFLKRLFPYREDQAGDTKEVV